MNNRISLLQIVLVLGTISFHGCDSADEDAPTGNRTDNIDAVVAETEDGGATWHRSIIPDVRMRRVISYGNDQWLALGYRKFIDRHVIMSSRGLDAGWDIDTLEGGLTYSDITVSNIDKRNAIIVGADGLVLRKAREEDPWTVMTSGTTKYLAAVDYSNGGVVVAVGSEGTIIRSTDFGASWSTVASPTSESLTDIKFNGRGRGVAVALRTVLISDDEGATWRLVPSPTSTVSGARTVELDEDSTIIVAAPFDPLVRSTDGGATWQTDPSVNAYPMVIRIWDTWYLFKTGKVKKSVDGINWSDCADIPDAEIADAEFLSDNYGVAVGVELE